MNKSDKELLLKDLCARLPYVVYFMVPEINEPVELLSINPKRDKPLEVDDGHGENSSTYWNLKDVKPYLRPMSSMTEEEKDYIKNVARFKQSDGIHYDDGVHYVPIYQETLDNQWKADGKFPPILGDIYRFMLEYGYILLIDFFNSHHLDYRGLIPMGLALEAHEGMYKTE